MMTDADAPPSLSDARLALREWRRRPRPLARPVLIVSGWMYPALMLGDLYHALRSCASNGEVWVHRSGCPIHLDIPRLGHRLATRYRDLSDQFGVDVVGISMGGIVAREAAREARDPRLRVVRLFTLGTPHDGARAIARLAPHHQAQSLTRGSSYLADLNADPSSRAFPIETFSLRGDHLVHHESAHAAGTRRYDWLNALLLPPHSALHRDPRIIMTIVARLLGH